MAIALWQATPGYAQDRVIGLLTLPEVFSPECAPFTPRPVTLYGEPRGATIGIIEAVELPRAQRPDGCFEVTVDRGQSRAALPNREHAYGSPAAIVLDQRDGWFKIRLSDGQAWVAPSPQQEFRSLATLFEEHSPFTELTGKVDSQLRSEPDGPLSGKPPVFGGDVLVKEVRIVGGRYWLLIEAMSHSVCGSTVEPVVVAKGWIPGHNRNGEPSVWFASRGC